MAVSSTTPRTAGRRTPTPPSGSSSAPTKSWRITCGKFSACLTPGRGLPATTHRHDYVAAYVQDLAAVVDLEAIRSAGVKIGVDPLGGASVAYWGPIRDRYQLDLTVVNEQVDPTFRFMTIDWDGKIRMDCSSRYAMASLIERKGKF